MPHWAAARLFLILMGLATLTVSPAHAQTAATQDDVEAAENRLQEAIDAVGTNVTALDGNISALMQEIANLTANVANITEEMGESYQDHVNIYSALTRALYLHDAQGKLVYQNNKTVPLLPLVLSNQQKILDNQQGIITTQFRTRGDLDNATEEMESGFNTLNEGNEQIFGRVDNSNNKVGALTALAALQFVVNMVLLSAYLRWPRKFWAWKDYQERRVEKRGEYVEPPCPKEGDPDTKGHPLAFRSFFVCPVKDACPVAEDCKRAAVEEMERAAVQDPETLPAPAAENGPPNDAGDEPDQDSEPAPAPRPLQLPTVRKAAGVSEDDFGGA